MNKATEHGANDAIPRLVLCLAGGAILREN